MTKKRMSRYTSTKWKIKAVVMCLAIMPMGAVAQVQDTSPVVVADSVMENVMTTIQDSVNVNQGEKPKAMKYIPTEEDMKQTFFQGFTVSTDILNLGLYFLSSYGNIEAALRLNLLNTYFPVAEVGLGRCEKDDFKTNIHYGTNAPYFKIGADYNVLKNKWQTNKLTVGFRYGFSNFNYSFSGPPQTDPIWNTTEPLDVHSINATSHYLEVVFGCQVKIWKFIHMGWSARFKKELYTTKSIYAHPYYIPGYGTTVSGTYWGATYNISFDLNWGKKKPTVKEVIENVTEDVKAKTEK